jgi:hypothetical protein
MLHNDLKSFGKEKVKTAENNSFLKQNLKPKTNNIKQNKDNMFLQKHEFGNKTNNNRLYLKKITLLAQIMFPTAL